MPTIDAFKEICGGIYDCSTPSMRSRGICKKRYPEYVRSIFATDGCTQNIQIFDPQYSTKYQICIRDNELPVIGTYISERITPGFYYRVRRISDGKLLWNGEALRLNSIGMGYGKRLTFKGNGVVSNGDLYFYSDTECQGFALIPATPEKLKNFVMIDENSEKVANVKLTSVEKSQLLLSIQTDSDRIEHRILCKVLCDIIFSNAIRETNVVGCELLCNALVRKAQANQEAVLVKYEDIILNEYGPFQLVPI